jgi:hypothetical protein
MASLSAPRCCLLLSLQVNVLQATRSRLEQLGQDEEGGSRGSGAPQKPARRGTAHDLAEVRRAASRP